ncbi:MAG: phage tail protein [Anaerolineae bacterium]
MKRNEIEQLLPEVFRRTVQPGNPLFALLEVMESLHEPSEEVLEQLDLFFDPYRTPDNFVPYLARWVDLHRFLAELPEPERGGESGAAGFVPFAGGLGRLRELIATAAYLSKWRGTATGLLRFLETAVGQRGFEIDEAPSGPDGRARPFHMLIRAPAETERYRVLIERIIEMEKPAYVTYDLEFLEG